MLSNKAAPQLRDYFATLVLYIQYQIWWPTANMLSSRCSQAHLWRNREKTSHEIIPLETKFSNIHQHSVSRQPESSSPLNSDHHHPPNKKKTNNKTKQKNINGKTFHLANKDKSLPTRPLVGSTELFNKFFHEVYHEGWCWSHVQLFYHFTNLEETRRKKPVNTKITPDHQHSQVWHAQFLQTALPACRRSSGQRTLCLHRGWKQ